MVSINDFAPFFIDTEEILCDCGEVYPVANGGCDVCGKECEFFYMKDYMNHSMRLPYSEKECSYLNILGFFKEFGIPLGTLTKRGLVIKTTDGAGVWFDIKNRFIGISKRGVEE